MNVKLLQSICNHLKIDFNRVYVDKSHSSEIDKTKTFFATQYVIKNTKDGNLYTTKYLFVNSSNATIIDEVDDSNTFYDIEAIQPSPTYILSKNFKFNNDISGVAVVTEESVKSCATLYSEKKLNILSLINNKIVKLLENYTIRKTNGESNCSGNYEMEILEKSIDITKDKTKGFYNLNIAKNFTYEEMAEENLDEGIKGKNIKKHKTEFETLIFDGKKYHFVKDEKYRFLDW